MRAIIGNQNRRLRTELAAGVARTVAFGFQVLRDVAERVTPGRELTGRIALRQTIMLVALRRFAARNACKAHKLLVRTYSLCV